MLNGETLNKQQILQIEHKLLRISTVGGWSVPGRGVELGTTENKSRRRWWRRRSMMMSKRRRRFKTTENHEERATECWTLTIRGRLEGVSQEWNIKHRERMGFENKKWTV